MSLAKKLYSRIMRLLALTAVLFSLMPLKLYAATSPIPAPDLRKVQNFVHAQLIPNDEHFSDQGYLSRIHGPEAWDIIRDHALKKDVVIAVLDTGVDIDHPDLKNRIWVNSGEIAGDGIDNDHNSYIDDVNGWDFLLSNPDPRPKMSEGYLYEAINHGTVVAGVLSAEPNNTIGIAGASFSAKIMSLRVLDNKGSGNTILLSQAVDYAVENGADVINLSLVGDVEDPRLDASIENAYKAGVAVVAASGNQEHSGTNLNESRRYPVCDSGEINAIIGVAAVENSNALASYSNYGSDCIDISAPGTNLYSTVWKQADDPKLNALYAGGWTGTSVAAPLVSATLAAIRQVAPNLTVDEMYRALLTGATSIAQANPNAKDLGAGLLNMQAALDNAIALSRTKPIRVVLGSGKGSEPLVIVKDKTGNSVAEFFAYAHDFRGGVNVASGDIEGDGESEIITIPLSNGGPHVRIFNLQGDLKGQFMAYDAKVRGGFTLEVGDVTGDGKAEIIVVPLQGGGPHVRIFEADGTLVGQFMAYAPQFRGGVNLALGDIDHDHILDILTAPASQGGPHVRIFDARGTLKGQFMAFEPSFRGGLSIAAGDLDHDGKDEIAATEISDTNVQVHIYNSSFSEVNRFLLFPEIDSVESPVNLLIDDYTGDRQPELLSFRIAPGMSFMVFDYYGQIIDSIDLSHGQTNAQAVRYSFALMQ